MKNNDIGTMRQILACLQQLTVRYFWCVINVFVGTVVLKKLEANKSPLRSKIAGVSKCTHSEPSWHQYESHLSHGAPSCSK